MLTEKKMLVRQGRISALLSKNYLYLLLSLSAVLVLWPMLQPLSLWAGVLEVLLFLTLWLCILAASRRPSQLGIALVLALVATVIRLDPGFLNVKFAYSSLVYGVFFAYAAMLMASHIFTDNQRVNINLIYGAISVYLLIGLAFAFAFFGLSELDMRAFSGVDYSPEGRDLFSQMIYFSFSTLPALGYGDIVPSSDLTRPLAYAEAILGQLYLTVLVARLVGMHLSARMRP